MYITILCLKVKQKQVSEQSHCVQKIYVALLRYLRKHKTTVKLIFLTTIIDVLLAMAI